MTQNFRVWFISFLFLFLIWRGLLVVVFSRVHARRVYFARSFASRWTKVVLAGEVDGGQQQMTPVQFPDS